MIPSLMAVSSSPEETRDVTAFWNGTRLLVAWTDLRDEGELDSNTEIYFNALWASSELAEASGPHPGYEETRAAAGNLQFDLWGVTPSDPQRWDQLRRRIAAHGLRNSLMIAIAPTATIASIAG